MAENNPYPGENNTGHFWDDNLRELTNPPPRWWMIAFWASVAWWVLYAILYPMWPALPGHNVDGKEFTPGILGWTSIKEYKKGVEQVEAVRAQYDKQIAGMTAEQIIQDPGLLQYTLASSKVLFGDHCAACHGSGGQGNPGYPVLADDDWLYGGTLAKITESITNGRKGAMTAHVNILSDAEIDQLANFVAGMSQGGKGSEADWALFNAKGCVACHGPKATGVIAELPNGEIVTVGAANLTDSIWRFRPGGYESAKHTITYGVNQPGVAQTRNAVMPSFAQQGKLEGRLTPEQIKMLTVYVHELGGGK
ncbi:MAG: cytochrome-c oxidase, cbb3-type subunit III [Thiohalocapsa sp.]|jgi:cytochrome c oxidase cbb3-type subunit 3|uniref:cytochrome-c oxidase, cbb3-type subunit III n=1 Tax=Thiohalocapsa sp. TaxID=2497641 RepID=UPI0025F54C93|nr:cytochrome-c oxidase, cbb3-type subunit III [Thiohalocapsa sp.]MCG6942188.1 cytochrome-c oxidase, cbb3-type subunit III [Thiohalocapsa sp.]